MDHASLADEKYVSLTTNKRDGTTKSVPVWIADLGDGTVGFTTSSSSYKVKRINNDPSVTLQPSDSKGKAKPGTEPTAGTATARASDFPRVREKIKAKYGIQVTMITLVGKMAKLVGKGSGTDTGVVVTLTDPS